MLLLLLDFIYIINPIVIDKFPSVTGKQPEPSVTTPSVTPIVSITPIISEIPSATVTNGTIKLAAFKLQVFGTTKAGEPEIMGVLSKIIRNYDVIAVK